MASMSSTQCANTIKREEPIEAAWPSRVIAALDESGVATERMQHTERLERIGFMSEQPGRKATKSQKPRGVPRGFFVRRGERIRTSDPLTPSQVR